MNKAKLQNKCPNEFSIVFCSLLLSTNVSKQSNFFSVKLNTPKFNIIFRASLCTLSCLSQDIDTDIFINKQNTEIKQHTDSKYNMFNLLHQLDFIIKNNNCLSFLLDDLKIVDSLEEFITKTENVKSSHNDILNNTIYSLSNKEILPQNWESIQSLITTSEKKEKNHFNIKFNEIIKDIQSIKGSKTYNILNSLLLNKSSKCVLKKNVKDYIYYIIRRKFINKEENIKITFISQTFNKYIGEQLFLYWVNKIPLFRKWRKLNYDNEELTLKLVNINLKYITKYIINYITTKNKVIISKISVLVFKYIKYHLAILKRKGLLKFRPNIMIENDLENNNKLILDINNIIIQQGNIILEKCSEVGIFQNKIKVIKNKKVIKKLRINIISARTLKEFTKKRLVGLYLNKNTNSYTDNIHSNERISLKINVNSYLFNNNKLKTKYAIDIPYLLQIFNLLISLNNNQNYTDNINVIYSLYGLDHIKIALLSNIDNKVKHIINSLNLYMIDFKTMDSSLIQKSIRNLFNKNKIIFDNLQSLFNKIINKKYIIKGLFKEAVLFSRFKYIFHDNFIDGRGRFYNNEIFTNTQIFPFAKILVKPFDGNIKNMSRYYEKITKTIKQLLSTDKLRNEISNITDYDNQYQKLHLKYLYNHFNDKITTYQEFTVWYNYVIYNPIFDYIKTFNWISQRIKAHKESIIIHSFISQNHCSNKMQHLGKYYELDARSSGLQMMALSFKSKNLAKLTKLIETDEVCDIYSLFNLQFNSLINDLKSFVMVFFNQINIYDIIIINDLEVNHKLVNNKLNIKDLIIDFMQIDFKSDKILFLLTEIEDILLQHKFTNYNSIAKQMYLKHSSITIHLLPKELRKHDLTPLKSYLLQIKVINEILSIRKTNKWDTEDFINDRERFKHAIMTTVYNSTSFSRRRVFTQQLLENNINSNKSDIHKFSMFLETCFIKRFVPTILPENNISHKISSFIYEKLLVKNESPISICNRYFNIVYKPLIYEKHSLNTAFYTKNKVRKRSSTYDTKIPTLKINRKKIKIGFMPNVIQSMDAFIVHYYKEFIMNLNSNLQSLNIPIEIFESTNHDCFCINLIPYLRIIIKDAYISLYNTNYFSNINLDCISYNDIQNIIDAFILPENKLLFSDLLDFNNDFLK